MTITVTEKLLKLEKQSFCIIYNDFSLVVVIKYGSLLSEYAQVTKMLGNGRLESMCFDGLKRLCHIRGKLRKKVSWWHFECCIMGMSLVDWKLYGNYYSFNKSGLDETTFSLIIKQILMLFSTIIPFNTQKLL